IEGAIEVFETASVLELPQVQLSAGADEVNRLRENLHQLARPEALLRQSRGESIDIVEAILVVLGGELPNRTVIQDRAVGEDVVAVPGQPVEDVFFFQIGRELAVRARDQAEHALVSLAFAGRKLPS